MINLDAKKESPDNMLYMDLGSIENDTITLDEYWKNHHEVFSWFFSVYHLMYSHKLVNRYNFVAHGTKSHIHW